MDGSSEAQMFRIKRRLNTKRSPPSLFVKLKATEGVGGAGSFETHMEKALWLGNNSVAEVYQQKKADGFYNRLLQYSLVQKVEHIESKIKMEGANMTFQTRIVLQIHRGAVTDTYELVTSGHLLQVERNFPHNPHGLLITDFFENSLRKLEAYESPKE